MSDRSQLVAFWQSRLLASEEQFAHGSPHLRWLRRMYIRVYRFLLSQYGEENNPPSTCDPPVSVMPLVDNTDHHGRPPKQPGKIQAILKDIHVANERLDKPGPLAKGMAAQEWIVIATRRDRWWPRKTAAWLRRSGVSARLVGYGRSAAVEVRRSDAPEARRLLEAGGESLRMRKGSKDDYPTLVFNSVAGGGIVGGFCGMLVGFLFLPWFAVILFDIDPNRWSMIMLACTVGGYAAGFLFGCWLGWRDATSRE